MLRPFELEIIKRIRTRPEGPGGRSVSRKGVWIRGHLQEVGRDYPYAMYKLWKRFLKEAGLDIKAGSYAAFRTYIYVLRRLGLIRRAGGSPSRWGKRYYSLNPDKVDSALWKNPFGYVRRNFLKKKFKNAFFFQLNLTSVLFAFLLTIINRKPKLTLHV